MKRVMPGAWRVALAVVALVSGAAQAVRVSGSLAPWVEGSTHTPRAVADALRDLYGGRADVALVTLPGPPPPPGTGQAAWVPVGVFAPRVVYRLPGVELKLDVRLACRILAGEVLVWNDPEVAALNPGEALPALPILTTARAVPNSASLAFADACVQGGWWPRSWRKSSWSAGAVQVRRQAYAHLADLKLPGSLGVLGVRERVAGTRDALLQTASGAFVPPVASVTGGEASLFPSGPWASLAAPLDPDAYPLRGLVWAVVMVEQQYRGRTREDALGVLRFVRSLQRAEEAGEIVPLGPGALPELRLSYGGKRLAEDVVFPPAP